MWFKRPLTIIDSTPDAQLYPRVGHSLVPQSSSNEALQFVLFGGASHEQGVMQDLWLIDLSQFLFVILFS